MINIEQLIKKYKRYEENVNHNIKQKLKQKQEYEDNPYYDEEIKEKVIISMNKSIENSKGQLAVVREIMADLEDKHNEYLNQEINYLIGEPI